MLTETQKERYREICIQEMEHTIEAEPEEVIRTINMNDVNNGFIQKQLLILVSAAFNDNNLSGYAEVYLSLCKRVETDLADSHEFESNHWVLIENQDSEEIFNLLKLKPEFKNYYSTFDVAHALVSYWNSKLSA